MPAFPEQSQADMAMVLSAIGLAGTLLSCCFLPLAIVTIPLCAAGAYIGWTEVKKIDVGLRNPAKRGQAQAAMWIGIVVSVLGALAVLLFIVFFGAALTGIIANLSELEAS